MQLLISAATVADAEAALAGGADVVDAKDPATGALGAVSLDVFRAIVAAVDGRRTVTAAIGDARDTRRVAADARAFASAGAALVKVGFADGLDCRTVRVLARAAVDGARESALGTGVMLVAYADVSSGVSPEDLLDIASAAHAAGVLIDTAHKRGPRLLELSTPDWLTRWVERAHSRTLVAALAGRLRVDDLPTVRCCGADVAGVRGSACTGGRMGAIDAATVASLRLACTLDPKT